MWRQICVEWLKKEAGPAEISGPNMHRQHTADC